MSKLLINYIKRHNNSRHNYGILSGIVGIICNLILCTTKFIVGSLSGSISITADALNNLSDMASNSVTIVGSKLASKPMDKEHPFGHGRIEYISALGVAGLIFVMGFELAKTSIEKIINPKELNFSIVYVLVLIFSILIKLWMAYFNKKLFIITDNVNLKAVKQDSLNDCIATFTTILSLLISNYFHILWFDGAIGLGVAIFIIISGINMVKDIIGPLLGQMPKKELVEGIENTIKEPEIILGVHDLIIHDYGPGRRFASAHAEVPSNLDVISIHNVINDVEQKILEKYNIMISIHMDPVETENKESQELETLAKKIVFEYNKDYSLHDFRIKRRNEKTQIIFDLIIPFSEKDIEKVNNDLCALLKAQNENLVPVITIEHSYV